LRYLLILVVSLLAENTPAIADVVSSDSQVAQTMITEIRDLRHDLWNTAAIIQRVQIAMYRAQAQTALLDKATQRLDQARMQCQQQKDQQNFLATQIRQAEERKQNPQHASDKTSAQEMTAQFKLLLEQLTGEMQHCQVEQTDAEAQFRAEEAKMNELQGQLDHLDQLLAGGLK
jgi:peptidoglycan hydrolase CwlO-like protein